MNIFLINRLYLRKKEEHISRIKSPAVENSLVRQTVLNDAAASTKCLLVILQRISLA